MEWRKRFSSASLALACALSVVVAATGAPIPNKKRPVMTRVVRVKRFNSLPYPLRPRVEALVVF